MNTEQNVKKPARFTKKIKESLITALDNDTSHDKSTEFLSYSRGTVTAHTMEKGYGDMPDYTKEYTKAPNRSELGFRWTDDAAYAASVFRHFECIGFNIQKLIHHGRYE